jgi:hypothetical protein
VLAALLLVSLVSPAEGQILDRIRRKATQTLDRVPGLLAILEKPPGVTTSIHGARTEVPFLDDYDPTGSGDMSLLPRNSRNAFMAPPGLYEMRARSYCIHAGTYGPTGGEGYSLAPLQGDLAPLLGSLVRRTVDHPKVAQPLVQRLIWAIQADTPMDELPAPLQRVARTLLTAEEVTGLSRDAVDLGKEELLEEALDRVPESVREVAELEADIRDKIRRGVAFEELEAVAVLTGLPRPEDRVREIPNLRWSYHPDGYFIRFDPDGYSDTWVQTYVPEPYGVERDSRGRVKALMGPHGIRVTLEYRATPGEHPLHLALLRGVTVESGGWIHSSARGTWKVDGWTLVGDDLVLDVPGGVVEQVELARRLKEARDRRREVRQVLAAAHGDHFGTEPAGDLTDLAHLRVGLKRAGTSVPETVLSHLARAWMYTLCVEAGACPPQRIAWWEPPLEPWIIPDSWQPRGRKVGLSDEDRSTEPTRSSSAERAAFPVTEVTKPPPATLYAQAGGEASIDAGGNVATPGNTGKQMLLQSGTSIVDQAEEAMGALGLLLGLVDVATAGSLGMAAYNALGLAGIPVGPTGIPMALAGAMISQVMGLWTTAANALAGAGDVDPSSSGGGGAGGAAGSVGGGGNPGASGGNTGSGNTDTTGDPGHTGDTGGTTGTGNTGDTGGGAGAAGDQGDGRGTDVSEGTGGTGTGGGEGADAGVTGDTGTRTASRSTGEDYTRSPPAGPPENPEPVQAGDGVSEERAEAANAWADALLRVLHHIQAMTDSQDRREAAAETGEPEWASRQAALVAHHRRQAGVAALEAARRLDRLLEIARREGAVGNPVADHDRLEAVQERLRAGGWTPEELRVAHLLGITSKEMEALRHDLLSLDPGHEEMEMADAAEIWMRRLRARGALWSAGLRAGNTTLQGGGQ